MTDMPHKLPTTTRTSTRLQEALDFLIGRINYERMPIVPYGERQLKLDRMRQLLTRLGNPDAGLPIVHVAGTKGKGSTSALIGSILHAAGYEVGLFSSPHLESIEERFAINGVPCSPDELVSLVDQLRPVVAAMDEEAAKELLTAGESSLSPTYFELTTAIALMYFAEQKVDIAILEVGMGGRLDSTNVCQPAVTVITSISFDHTKQLGNTLAKIAAEKAGIIKPGVPVLCGPLTAEPRAVIAEIAKQHGCRLLEAGKEFTHQYRPPRQVNQADQLGQLDFSDNLTVPTTELTDLPLQLLGEHQAANAALAVATCIELQRQSWSISAAAIRIGLATLTLPARVEILGRRPTIVLDVAHNVASAGALVDVLKTSFSAGQRILILATSKDKDVPGIVGQLLPYFDRVIATQYHSNPRAVPATQLAEIIRQQLAQSNDESSTAATQVVEIAEANEALQLAQQWANASLATEAQTKEPLICITGSFFIAAELRRAWSGDA